MKKEREEKKKEEENKKEKEEKKEGEEKDMVVRRGWAAELARMQASLD